MTFLNLSLGTAQIIQQANGAIFLRYMSHGSFTVGERFFGRDEQAARQFCRQRDLRVL